MSTTLNKAIETFDLLAFEEKEVLQDVINKAMIEAARKQFKINRDEVIAAYEAGKLKGYSNSNELMEALLNDDKGGQ